MKFASFLHTGGKISSEEAFAAVSSLWWELAEAYLPLVRSQTIHE
ncbi:hypothetical protein RYO59_001194 [Thermosynechococcaceae cyanobacterium Okahandja]